MLRRWLGTICWLLGLLVVNETVVVWADTEIAGQLQEIQAAVETESAKLATLHTKLVAGEKVLGGLEQDLKTLRVKEAQLNSNITRLITEEQAARLEIARLARQIEKTRRLAVQRIRAVYEGRSRQALEQVFIRASSRNFVRNIFFLSKIKGFDQEMLRRAQEEMQSYEINQGRLKELLEEPLRILL